MEFLLHSPEIRDNGEEITVLFLQPAFWGLGEEIIENGSATGLSRKQKPAAAKRRQDRFGYGRRAKPGQGRIEGVASFF